MNLQDYAQAAQQQTQQGLGQISQQQGYQYPSQQGVCPHCGFCPHCGRQSSPYQHGAYWGRGL